MLLVSTLTVRAQVKWPDITLISSYRVLDNMQTEIDPNNYSVRNT